MNAHRIRWTTTLLVVISLVGVAGVARGQSSSPTGTPPQPVPSSSRLLFLSQRGYLASVGLDGQDYRKLPIDGFVAHFDVASSMDRMLYVVAAPGGDQSRPIFRLFVSDLEGGSPTLITDQVGDPNIYVGQPDPRPTFVRCGGATYPHWAADGRRILYAGWREEDGAVPFYIADVVDKTEKLLVRLPAKTEGSVLPNPLVSLWLEERFERRRATQLPPVTWYCSNLRWGPDGQSVTWVTESRKEFEGIWLRNLEGLDVNDARSVTSGTRLPFAEEFLWAPNGERVALLGTLPGGSVSGHRQLLVVERRTGAARTLHRDLPTQRPAALQLLAWSPDSTKLAFFVSADGQPRAIRIVDLAAVPAPPPVEVTNVQSRPSERPALEVALRMMRRNDFSPDGQTFFYSNPVMQGNRWTASTIEAFPLPAPGAPPPAQPGAVAPPTAPAGQPGTPPASAPRPGAPGGPAPPAPATIYKHTERIYALAVVTPRVTEVVAELPLVIPAAPLEGTLKAELTAKKQEVLKHLAAAKAASATKRAIEGQVTDRILFLTNWYDANRGGLTAEQEARKAAEAFFKLLALSYDRMTEAERETVENGLFDRAMDLRRARTVYRGTVREKAGVETVGPGPALEAYYQAVSRATWASHELDALVRMWGAVNVARVAFHGAAYNVYDWNPTTAPMIQDAQRRHFEALVDSGIVALLASESRLEAGLDAQKDRFFTFKEGLGLTGGAGQATGPAGSAGPGAGGPASGGTVQPGGSRAIAGGSSAASANPSLRGVLVELLSQGFSVFDLAAGLTADGLKVFLRDPTAVPGATLQALGVELKTRAEKLEQQAMEHWDRTHRKLVMLVLLKRQTPGKISVAAEAAARGRPLTGLELLPRRLDTEDIRTLGFLTDDRTFVDATDGGLLRILSTALVDLRTRCRMELQIALEQTRLLGRDIEASDRVARGRDPETGEVTWATILSPTTWGDLLGQQLINAFGPSKDLSRRALEIAVKTQQREAMAKLEDSLLLDRVGCRFEELPPDAWAEHVRLWATSAPYAAFVLKVSGELRASALQDWRRDLRTDLDRFPAAKQRREFYEELVEHFTEVIARAEQRHINRLKLEDYIFAWDLGGALSLAEAVANAERLDPEDDAEGQAFAGIAQLLRDTIGEDRAQNRAIALLRNVGDMGFTNWAFGGFSLKLKSTVKTPGFTRSFGRYVFEQVNPFAMGTTKEGLKPRAARAVLTQAATEIVVDLGVPVVGHKYEALLNQLIGLAVDHAVDRMAPKVQDLAVRLRQAAEAEQARYRSLDAQQYIASLVDRASVRTLNELVAFRRALASAREIDVRASLQRQLADVKRLSLTWAVAGDLSKRAAALRSNLRAALTDPDGVRAGLIGVHRALEAAIMPPTRQYYEWVLTTHAADLFHPDKGFDVDKLRADFKAMRGWIGEEHRPALDLLEARIDQIRQERFLGAMTDFLTAHGGQLEGVILNGTAPGNPEYKGLFSDKDFTLLIKPGVDPADIRQKVNAAFEKRDIALNEKGVKASADIEAMVQDFLPGDVPPITTLADFGQWAVVFSKDPTRYLSVGGGEWVGLYNYLSGGTLSLQDGQAVIDRVPNEGLLKRPDLHPSRALGLVLDAARFDKLRHPAAYGDAQTLGEVLGTRAKNVLRAVDALIWTLRPERVKARTREAAQSQGYHQLIVDDALALHDQGVLSLEEFETIELLADLKRGKTAFQALGIDPRNPEAGRASLEAYWLRMNALMKRAYTTTYQVHREYLQTIADTLASNPAELQAVFTLAFRNWNAARKIVEGPPFGRLAILTGHEHPDPLAHMKAEDLGTIRRGAQVDVIPDEPTVRATEAEVTRWLGRDDDPAAGAELAAEPTAFTARPGTPPAEPIVELYGNWRKGTKTTADFVDLWHGTRGFAGSIDGDGFPLRDKEDGLYYFGNSRHSAESAVKTPPNPRDPVDPGVFQFRIPGDVWNRLVDGGHIGERPYPVGFGGANPPGTMEYTLLTREGIAALNGYRERVDKPSGLPPNGDRGQSRRPKRSRPRRRGCPRRPGCPGLSRRRRPSRAPLVA